MVAMAADAVGRYDPGEVEEPMTAFSRHIAAGEYLFREGDPPDCAYVIDSGQIEVSTEKDGRKLVLSHLGAGDLLGEMAVLDDAPRTIDDLVRVGGVPPSAVSATLLSLELRRLVRKMPAGYVRAV